MKHDEIFQSYEHRDEEIEDGRLDLAVEFEAAGRNHVYFGGVDRISFLPVVIVGNHGDTFAQAARHGTIVTLEADQKPHDRALVMERGVIANLPVEDALRLGTSKLSLEEVDHSFEIKPKP